MTAATLAAKPAAQSHCKVSWCAGTHDAPRSGDEILWHGRVFAEQDGPNGHHVAVSAGWGQPLTQLRVRGASWCMNTARPPCIRIAFRDDTGTSGIELEVFNAMVLADSLKATGGGWLAQALANAADEVNDGTPEGQR